MSDVILNDGFMSLANGMDSSLDPAQLAATQFARGVNINVRDGLPKTRDGFSKVSELASGAFQGAKAWSLNRGDLVVFVIAGRVYAYDITAVRLQSAEETMSVTAVRCTFEQVDHWMVVQDGVSRPLVLDINETGTLVVYGRNPPNVCLVPGHAMLYAHQRLHYVPSIVPTLDPPTPPYDVLPIDSTLDGRMCFVSSDIRDSLNPEWVFRMSEHRVLNEGGALALPEELGFITAFGALRGAATGTGVGEVIVFAREGVSAFDLSIDRTQWKAVNISRVLFSGSGTVSPASVTNANNDLLYLDTDGYVRRLMYAYAEASGSAGTLSNLPISLPMQVYHDRSPGAYLPEANAALVNNRYLFTLGGRTDGAYDALGVLDLARAYSPLQQVAMRFDGVWTGFDFRQVVSVRDGTGRRLYAIVGAPGGRNVLLRQIPGTYTDIGGTPIDSHVVTKVMEFNSQERTKSFEQAELWISDVRTPVDLTIYFRPHGYPAWTPMVSKHINVPGGGPQYRHKLLFAIDKDSLGCDNAREKPLNVGDNFQFAVRWKGYCRIDRLILAAYGKQHPPEDPCQEDNPEDARLPVDEGLDDFAYKVTL